MKLNNRLIGTFFTLFVLASLAVGVLAPPASAQVKTAPNLIQNFAAYDWLQFNGDAQHSGNNTKEIMISKNNVSSLAQLFQATLPDVADGAPVMLSGVSTAGGVKDLAFVTTKNGWIVALDAKTGSQVWAHQYGPAGCKINNGPSDCYTTSSPAIDPNRLYVYSYGLDGYVHKYQVGDGSEITGSGWPELTTLKAFDEKGSPALNMVTTNSGATYLYAANGGYPGDNGDYQGHITVINLASGAQQVFNALCSDQTVHFVHSPGSPDCPEVQTAIWSRAAVIYDAETGRIYMATGNGAYNPGSHDWSDSVFALNPDGSGLNGNPLDSFTPADQQALQNADLDLGSTAPAILPRPAGTTFVHLAVQGGKDVKLRLINLDDLSGQGGPGHLGGEIGGLSNVINVPQGGQVLTQPAVWTNPADGSTWVFVANNKGISGLRLWVNAQGVPSLSSQWVVKQGGTSPIVAANVLYYAGASGLQALNPQTGALLWSAAIGGIHWESPVVAGGIVYITDEASHLTAYSLNGALPAALGYRVYAPVIQ
jgi:hypothetical protein